LPLKVPSHSFAERLECTYASVLGDSTSSYISSERELDLKAPGSGVSLITSKAFTYPAVRKTEDALRAFHQLVSGRHQHTSPAMLAHDKMC
jgi:hypothetical protein